MTYNKNATSEKFEPIVKWAFNKSAYLIDE